ncbi:translocation protein SEC62 [Nasonia vitripennis]|uniref:Translocation protein SEC62 n=1 Tax=Nasonia vitripennis TaxID=7425 RepID=A0A7M7GG16_NASVI|nr:translocation protein SEC62 [Nasonia vitripennis]
MVVERRKNKKRKDDGYDRPIVADKPSKEEYAVAKWIRNNVPSKKTKFDRNHIVEYFTGTRAVDALLDHSPWSQTLFESRQHVVDFLDTMLRHKFFHRAKKIVITEDELIRIKGIKKKPTKDSKDLKEDKKPAEKEKQKEKEKEKDKDKDKEKDKDENDSKGGDKEDKKDGNEKQEKRKDLKKKPKVRLEMHMDQYFVDCNDAYVWIYEPIPVYYWFFGTLLVLGAIGVCLFPLWPLTVRHGVWYLSIAAAGFLIFILSLIVIRVIVFCILWVLTLGRHHLWLLPNLIEDVGFFASFWPLYHYQYLGPNSNDAKKKKKRKKDKDSDAEDGGNSHSEEKSGSSSEASKPDSPSARKSPKEDGQHSDGHEASEEGSESDKSNTGGDFEML